jgi:YbbR domain-containing protein
VTLRLAREIAATVPISIVRQGQPPFSFSVGDMTQGAEEAVVRGPEELVGRVASAMATVDVQGQTVDLVSTLELTAVDQAGDPVEGVTVEPESVSVRVPIVAEFGVQQVSVVPAVTGQPAPGFAVGRIDWEPKIVEVFTSGVLTGTLATEAINLNGVSSAITETVALERLPNVITRPQTVPVTVSVEIVPIAVPSQLPLLVPVSPTNLGEGLSAPLAQPASVQVILAGPFEQLSQLANTPGAVVATVDLRDLRPGTYPLPVQIQVPPGLQLVSTEPPVVSVTILPPPTPTPQPSPTPAATTTATPEPQPNDPGP